MLLTNRFSYFRRLPDLEERQISKTNVFTRARSFNRPLNNWNVSKVETMFAMFDDATSLNQPLHAPWYHEESEDESDTDSDSE